VDWFDKNGMAQYNMNSQLVRHAVIDDITNAIALRSDLHTTFDTAKFVVVPKQDAWVAHFTHLTNDLGKLYHNTAVAIDNEVSANCLLARFAWAIFPLVSKFLMAGAACQVRTRVLQDGELTEVTETITAGQAKANLPAGAAAARVRASERSPTLRMTTSIRRHRHCIDQREDANPLKMPHQLSRLSQTPSPFVQAKRKSKYSS
jgi:hypothetical protein